MGHSSGVCMHVIMYTTQGHCVGVEPLYICMSDWLSPLVCVMQMAEQQQALYIVPVYFSVLVI